MTAGSFAEGKPLTLTWTGSTVTVECIGNSNAVLLLASYDGNGKFLSVTAQQTDVLTAAPHPDAVTVKAFSVKSLTEPTPLTAAVNCTRS